MKIYSFYNTEDSHGPSGLAMTASEILNKMLFEKTKPIAGLRPEIRNPNIEIRIRLKGYLKEQSQFSNRQNDVKSIFTMVYGDFDELR